MHSVCISRGEQLAKQLEKLLNVSTKSTQIKNVDIFVPQNFACLHNFTTQYSTSKKVKITGVEFNYSTVSTEPITTTTII